MKKTSEIRDIKKWQPEEIEITDEDVKRMELEYKARFRRARLEIKIDANLVEYPVAIYDKKTKENWVRYISDDGEMISEIGSPDGCWTGFDERVFKIGMMRHTKLIPGMNLLMSFFTCSQIREALNEDVSTQRLMESIKKIVTTHIRHKKFIVNKIVDGDKNKDYWVLDGLPLTQRYILTKSEERGECFIIWNSFLIPNWTRYYHKLNYDDYKRVKSPIEWRIFEYISRKLTGNKTYPEHWEKLCKKIPITTVNTTWRLKTLTDHLNILPKLGIQYAPKDPQQIRKKEIIRFKRTKYFKGYIKVKEEENPTLEEKLRTLFVRLDQDGIALEPYATLKNYFRAVYPDLINLTTFNKDITPNYLNEIREEIQKEDN